MKLHTLLLPGAVTLIWLLAWGATIRTLATSPAAPQLLAVDGMDDWRKAQSYRLRCQFAGLPIITTPDALWTGCGREEDGVELVRFDLAGGRLQRGWTLPEAPGPIYLEAAVALEDDALAVVVTRAKGEESRSWLLELSADGDVKERAALEIEPLSVRGLKRSGDGFELVLANCRWAGVNPAGEVAFMPLPACPAGDGASVEWTRPTAEGWDVLWSKEETAATAVTPGARAVFNGDKRVGSLATTLTFPFGEYVEFAPGGAINLAWGGAWRYDGGPKLIKVAKTLPYDGEWMMTVARAYVATTLGLTPIRRWLAKEGGGLAISVGEEFLKLTAPQRGWAIFGQTPVPAKQGGGFWLADLTARYLRVDDELNPTGGPGWAARLGRVLGGGAHQATAYASNSDDGLLDVDIYQRQRRMGAAWLYLLVPLILLPLMWVLRRRFLIGDLLGGAYVIGCGLLFDALQAGLQLL